MIWKLFLVSKYSLDIEQYVEFEMSSSFDISLKEPH